MWAWRERGQLGFHDPSWSAEQALKQRGQRAHCVCDLGKVSEVAGAEEVRCEGAWSQPAFPAYESISEQCLLYSDP